VDSLAGQIGLGVALAACAGLRAFVPLLVAGVAARLELLPLAARFEWLASDAALVVFGVAVVVEIAADKIPLVDHALDLVATLLKPAAGTVLAAGMLGDLGPVESTALGLVTGGGVAATVHVAKAKLRVVSTLATVGLANPLLSLLEDVLAFAGAVATVLVPLVLLGVVLVAALGALFFFAARRR